MKQERARDWVRLLGNTNSEVPGEFEHRLDHPNELFHGGRCAWDFPHSFVLQETDHQQALAKKAKETVTGKPARYQVGETVLVHHSCLPFWTRMTLQDPYFGPDLTFKDEGTYAHVYARIHVMCCLGCCRQSASLPICTHLAWSLSSWKTPIEAPIRSNVGLLFGGSTLAVSTFSFSYSCRQKQ